MSKSEVFWQAPVGSDASASVSTTVQARSSPRAGSRAALSRCWAGVLRRADGSGVGAIFFPAPRDRCRRGFCSVGSVAGCSVGEAACVGSAGDVRAGAGVEVVGSSAAQPPVTRTAASRVGKRARGTSES